jgi:hypothetical protein
VAIDDLRNKGFILTGAGGAAASIAFIVEVGCPHRLPSYEKALMFPSDFVDALVELDNSGKTVRELQSGS